MAYDYGKAGNLAHYNQVSQSTLYEYYKGTYPLHHHMFSTPYEQMSLYKQRWRIDNFGNFCLSVNTSSV